MKKLIVFLLIGLFLASFTSALEFDNLDVEKENLKKVKIENLFGLGGKIADITLNTPLEYKVHRGYNKVAEFEVIGYTDYKTFLSNMEFYDLKNSKERINRDFDFKTRTYESVLVEDWDWVDTKELSVNKTPIKKYVKVGEHYEKREVWTNIEYLKIEPGTNLTIGIFTDVQAGDKVDWIPTFAGVRVAKWATWTEDLYTGLTNYYKLENVTDSIGGLDLTNSGADFVAGKIDNGADLELGDPDYLTNDLGQVGTWGDSAVNIWIKEESHTAFTKFLTWGNANDNRFSIMKDTSTGQYLCIFDEIGQNQAPECSSTTATSTGTWYMITMNFDATNNNISLYINGEWEYSLASTGEIGNLPSNQFNLGADVSGTSNFDGILDELGVWANRTLTEAEIVDLYNNATGLQPQNGTSAVITVDVQTPANNTLNGYRLQTFTANVTSDDTSVLAVDNVTFYLDDTAIYTNATGGNGVYNYDYVFNDYDAHNWTVKAYGNDSVLVEGNTHNLQVNDSLWNGPNQIAPSDGANFTSPQVPFNCTATDTYGVLNLSLMINGTIEHTETGAGNTNLTLNHIETMTAGTFNWSCIANNNISSKETSDRSLSVAFSGLSVSLDNPPNSGSVIKGNSNFTCSVVSGLPVENVTLYTNQSGWGAKNISYTVGSYGVIAQNLTNQTVPSDGTWRKYKVYNLSKFVDYALIWRFSPNVEVNYQFIYEDASQENISSTTITNFTNPYPQKKVDVINVYAQNSVSPEDFGESIIYGWNASLTDSQTFTRDVQEPLIWNCLYCDNIGNCTFASSNYTLLVDEQAPQLEITYPVGTLGFGENGYTETLNWTVSDPNLDSCWYNLNGTNVTVNCSANSTTFTVDFNNLNITMWANDSSGNINSSFASWNYTLLQIAIDYVEYVTEGSNQQFLINVSSGQSISSASLVYDGTSYLGSISSMGGNVYQGSRNLSIPYVSSDQNKTFYWSFVLDGGSVINSTSSSQRVYNLDIDDCGANSELLYNFTIYDEKNQSKLNPTTQNTTAKAKMDIYDTLTNTLVTTYSNNYNKENSFAFCLANQFAQYDSYKIDLELSYTADEYAQEFYNIEDETISASDLNTSIALYLLDNDTAQSFKLTYRDESFLPVPGAVIQLQRKYIDEGLSKTVEQPKMDENGETLVQVELEDVIYTINVLVDGEIDATFNDIRFYCPNPLIEDCSEVLNKFESYVDIKDYATVEGVSFAFGYNDTTRTVTSTYSVLSGVSKTIDMNVSLFDAFGNESVCSDSITSSSGTLSCVVPSSFGNSSVVAELYDSGELKGRSIIRVGSGGVETYGLSIVFISLIAVIMLVGLGLIGEPIIAGVFLILGLIVLVALNLVFSTSWIGAGATFLWFIIAVVLVIVKGGNR